MWTYEDNTNLIENLIIRSCLKDGVLIHYTIYPCDGYVLRIPALDEYETDEEGNYVLDENGERIIIPYCSEGGATAMPDYDWAVNPRGFAAEACGETEEQEQ